MNKWLLTFLLLLTFSISAEDFNYDFEDQVWLLQMQGLYKPYLREEDLNLLINIQDIHPQYFIREQDILIIPDSNVICVQVDQELGVFNCL